MASPTIRWATCTKLDDTLTNKSEIALAQPLGAAQTLEFVRSHLKPGSSILDAGCGDGSLAKLLSEAGFLVTALDIHEEAIEEAKAFGVSGLCLDFVNCNISQINASPFDAIVFSRSLHHMHPLDAAIEQAHKLLKEGGLLLLEDFGVELLDLKSAIWFYGLKALLENAEAPIKTRGPKLEEGRIPADPIAHWHHYHSHHQITDSGKMIAGLQRRFCLIEQQRLPYLYRYFLDNITHEQGQQLLRWESTLCQIGSIQPVGVRLVARRQ